MKIFIAALCVCCLSALAAPACVSGTYLSYQNLTAGCSIGDATFSSFSALNFVNSPGVPALTPGEIQVIPSSTSGSDMLQFEYLNANASPTPVTINQNGQIFSFDLSFQLLVVPTSSSSPNLTGIQMGSTFSNTAPGSVSADKSTQLVSGGPAVNSVVNDGAKSNPLGTYEGTAMPLSGVGPFLITDTTTLAAETGSVTQAGFNNSFLLSTGSSQTPEIGSLAMIGSGLVFLSLVVSSTRKRRRAKN